MAGCCCNENDAHLQHMREQQARMLWAVLAINAIMFVVEFTAGWWSGSTALMADSLDMLGDAMVYALSLFVVARSLRWKAVSAGFKGSIMFAFGVLVIGEAVHKAISGHPPESGLMMAIGGVALAANIVCLILLTRHRNDDVNMSSSWICSRNDLFANTGVIVAAVLVYASQSVWPDIIVGAIIAALFLQSSIGVLRQAREAHSNAVSSASTTQA